MNDGLVPLLSVEHDGERITLGGSLDLIEVDRLSDPEFACRGPVRLLDSRGREIGMGYLRLEPAIENHLEQGD